MNAIRFSMVILVMLATFSTEAEEKVIDSLSTKLNKHFPGVSLENITPTPVRGIYQVLIGTQAFYISANGRYIFSGHMHDLSTGRDLTESVMDRSRAQIIAGIPETRMVIFEPQGQVKHTISTFTDIDCPYCRKMHSEIGQLNDQGIRVRYLFFPRAGVNSESYKKAVAVWCADDRNAAMTTAKKGLPIPYRTCENPEVEYLPYPGTR